MKKMGKGQWLVQLLTMMIACLLILLLAGCAITPKPKIQITHVLAITQEGDTLQIPIDAIRPINYRVINYGYDYNWYRPNYYYNPYPVYKPINGGNYSNNNNSSNNTSKPTQTSAPREIPSVNHNVTTPVNPRKN
tara:strand:+ start:325 stop:729 length:405 start_codon:yes stop_codon:yes gene_type:complete